MDTIDQPAARGRGAVIGHRRCAEVIDRIHRESGPDLEELLGRLTQAALSCVPGAAHAGVTIADRTAVHSVGATDEIAQAMARLTHRLRQGPAIEAPHRHLAVQVVDIGAETRWPSFAESVLRETPVRSLIAMPLFHDDEESGALSVYADRPGGWRGDAEDTALTFGVHAALVVEQRRRERRYRAALTNRDTIGQAKGMLMERFKIDSPTAFALLAQLSRERHESVAAVARRVVRNEQLASR